MADSVRLTEEGQRILEKLKHKKGWSLLKWSMESGNGSSTSTLKRFLGGRIPVKRENAINFCNVIGLKNYEEYFITSCLIKLNWNRAPVLSAFYGRTEELENLQQWIIEDRCQVVAIHGAKAIGKTALALKLAEQIESNFDYLIWYQLRSAPPSLEIFLTEILELLYNNSNSELPQEGQNVSDHMFELMNFFHENRCLLLLDGIETTLISGDYAGCYQDKYKNYGEFIKNMAGEQHQSCLIVTSREKTEEIAIVEGEDQLVRSYKLQGLGEAAREILRAKKLSGEDKFRELIQTYRGNPLTLRIVSTYIKKMYNGDVEKFIKERTTLVPKSIYEFLDPQFNCLSEVEKNILSQLANQQEPVSLPQLEEISSFSAITVNKAIESLMERDLIEGNTTGFTLVQVIREYVLEKLKPKED